MKKNNLWYTFLVVALLGITEPMVGKVTIGRIVDTQGSTLTCDLTIGTFEGTGTILNGTFTFLTSALFSGCTSTGSLFSTGSFNATNSTIYIINITGEQNTIAGSTITTMHINPTTELLERKYLTVSGTTTIATFAITTHVTLLVQGNNVTINGIAVPEGTYELEPNQVFP